MQSKFEIDALDAAGCGLRAAFMRQGDRYDHLIVAVSPDGETPLLAAEGLPLQEIVEHGDEGRRTLLITGAGAGEYWSATVSSTLWEGLSILSFDVACRRKNEDGAPAVAYRLADGVDLKGTPFLMEGGRGLAVIATVEGRNASLKNESSSRLIRQDGRLLVQAAPHVAESATAQWRYEVTLAR